MCLLGCSEVSRREVVAGLAAAPVAACGNAKVISPPGVTTRVLNFRHNDIPIQAFVALPAAATRSIVSVHHGNPGIPEDVKDTVLWLASLGYAGVAVDPTARHPDIAKLPRTFWLGSDYVQEILSDTRTVIAKLRDDKVVGRGRTALFGYCGGGYVGYAWGASPNGHELTAMVGAHVASRPLRSEAGNYRRPAGIDLYRQTRMPVQLHQGGADQYTPPEDIAEQERVARETGKVLEIHVYPGAEHGFPMFTQPSYRPEYAKLVRARAAVFLKRHLG